MGRYSAVVTALIDRVQSHLAPGKLLDGYKWEEVPTKEVEGIKDLPVIRLFLPDLKEVPHTSDIVDGEMTFKMTVSTKKSEGIPAFLLKVETVMDALELDVNLNVNMRLNGTLKKPMNISLQDSYATEISLTAQLLISCLPQFVTRGERRN